MTDNADIHQTASRQEMTVARPPIFLPLNKKWYWQFIFGEKSNELRLYGKRWNEKTCAPGRRVTLSCGYNKQHRRMGTIIDFEKRHGSTFSSQDRAAIMEVYGTLDIWIACFEISLDPPP